MEISPSACEGRSKMTQVNIIFCFSSVFTLQGGQNALLAVQEKQHCAQNCSWSVILLLGFPWPGMLFLPICMCRIFLFIIWSSQPNRFCSFYGIASSVESLYQHLIYILSKALPFFCPHRHGPDMTHERHLHKWVRFIGSALGLNYLPAQLGKFPLMKSYYYSRAADHHWALSLLL